MAQSRTEHEVADPAAAAIGRRIRRIRMRQRKSLKEIGGLAGIGAPHLSRLERGLRPLNSRTLAQALASALGVPMSTLFEEPDVDSDAAVAAGSLRIALAGLIIDGPPIVETPPWEQLLETYAVVERLRPRAEYIGVALLLPEVLAGFHAHTFGPHRRDALIGLASGFQAAQSTARNTGAHDLALLAGHQLAAVTTRLDGPEWAGLADWSTALVVGAIDRRQARTVARTGLDRIDGRLENPRAVDAAGLLHLLSAHTAAVLGRTDDIGEHLTEAHRLAREPGTGQFSNLRFTEWNVRAWETAIAVELGEYGRAMELAQTMHEAGEPPSSTRYVAWLMDFGRAAATRSQTRPMAKRAFVEAEAIAPQRVRADPWAKATVLDLRNRARTRDRELEELAERIGVG